MENREAIEALRDLLDATQEYPHLDGMTMFGDAITLAISALEKQVPMPVRITTSTKRCSNCGRQLSAIGNIHPDRRYCVKCGQAIEWR